MNIEDDPNLTAYALDELELAERAAMEERLRAEPAGAAEVKTVRDLAAYLRAELAREESPGLNDARRAELLAIAEKARQARAVGGAGLPAPAGRPRIIPFWRSSWFPLAAAASLMLALGASYFPTLFRTAPKASGSEKLAFVPAAATASRSAVALNPTPVALRDETVPSPLLPLPAPPLPAEPAAVAGKPVAVTNGIAASGGLSDQTKIASAESTVARPMISPQSTPEAPSAVGSVSTQAAPSPLVPGALIASSETSASVSGTVSGALSPVTKSITLGPPKSPALPMGAAAAPPGKDEAPADLAILKMAGPRPASPAKPAMADGFVATRDRPSIELRLAENSAALDAVEQEKMAPLAAPVPAAAPAVRRARAAAAPATEVLPPAVSLEMAACPWAPTHRLIRIAAAPHLAAPDPSAAASGLSSVQIHLDPQQVASYRIVTEASPLSDAPASTASPVSERPVAALAAASLIEIIPTDNWRAQPANAEHPLPPGRAGAPAAAAQPAEKSETRATPKPLLTVKIRAGSPSSQVVSLIDSARPWTEASSDFQASASAAVLGLVVHDSPFKGSASWELSEDLAKAAAKSQPEERGRALLDRIEKAKPGKGE